MMNPEEEPKKDSRFVRRSVARHMRNWDARHSGTADLDRRISSVKTSLDQTLEPLRNASERSSGIATFVYQEEPVLFPYLAARYQLPALFDEIYGIYLEQREDRERVQVLERAFIDRDIFTHRVGESWLFSGTSLADIEQMSLNGGLSIQDISRINRIFYKGPFANEKDTLVQWATVALATQNLARPFERIKITDQAKPLQDRLTAYWQYYIRLMTDFSPAQDKINLLMLKSDRPKLLEALGVCIPALLGITPSSAIKLYLRRAMVSPMHTAEIIYQTSQSFRKNNLPPDLERFQHIDLIADAAARARLETYYGKRRDDQTQAEMRPEMLVDRLGYYRKYVQGGIVNYTLQEGFPAPTATVVSQYRDSLIFILRFDDQVHLTLDLGRDNRLYGLPPKLAHENPHIEDLILADILRPFLAALKQKYPLAEPIIPQPITREEIQVARIPAKRVRPSESLYTKRIREGQGLKRRLTPILQALSQPRSRRTVEEPKAQVVFSQAQVKEFLGAGASEKIADRIIGDIEGFQHGRGRIKKIKDANDLWELRSGDHRIMLEVLEGRSYRIVGIVERKNLERFIAGYK